jgi:activator of HSP90 ATPase
VTYMKKALPPVLKEKFNAFRPALLATHGNNNASAEAPPAQSGSTPAPAPAAPAPAAQPKAEPRQATFSTATVEVKADLQASADDIWGLLTDDKRIPMWSRSPAKVG